MCLLNNEKHKSANVEKTVPIMYVKNLRERGLC